ncbi:MAG: helix-hairpin-helix domain-containing protein [Pseudomonadota bacterium]
MQQRIIIVVLAILVALPVVFKSRVNRKVSVPAAFSIVSSTTFMVRISGDVRHGGVYSLGANSLTLTAIEMAEPVRQVKGFAPGSCDKRNVTHGDHLHLELGSDGTGMISCGSMSAKERMVLGIPLDINAMSATDFENLPGLGPVTAQRIVEYRQKNGGKMGFEELQAVEGIGEKKHKSLFRYF